MKSTMFSTLLTRSAVVAFLVAFTAIAASNFAAASDHKDRLPKGDLYDDLAGVSHRVDESSSDPESDLLYDFDRARLLRIQFVPASTCFTFAGPTCPMRVAVPVGAPCTCYFPGGYLPGTAY